MRQRDLKKVFYLSRSLAKAFLTTVMNLFEFAVRQLMLEMFFAVSVIGFSSLFVSWGFGLPLAFILAIVATLCLVILLAYICFGLNYLRKPQGETKLAQRISRILTNKKSTQWHEYQDWLHDIMLSRQQLLDNQRPQWQVKLITYKRLSVFCLVVGISKIKQAALSIRRSP